MEYKITEVILDMAEKYRVRVSTDENNSIFLKFDHYPTQQEINEVVENYIATNRQETTNIPSSD